MRGLANGVEGERNGWIEDVLERGQMGSVQEASWRYVCRQAGVQRVEFLVVGIGPACVDW